VFLQLLPLLRHKLLQALLLAPASWSGLTAGEMRGVSPADLRSTFFRSRRPRRVETAATSTRFIPLQHLSGNTAAAGDASSSAPARSTRWLRRWQILDVPEDPKGLFVFSVCLGFFLKFGDSCLLSRQFLYYLVFLS
jgi:hypothetical protein